MEELNRLRRPAWDRQSPKLSKIERLHRKSSSVDNFAQEIEGLLPGLSRYAQYLTHDATAADDLVQETVAHGIEKIHLWRQGTDLRAWLSAILHNLYVTGVRRAARNRAKLERVPVQPPLTCLPRQIARLELRDIGRGLATLPAVQRSAVMSVALGGERYEAIAARLGVPVGTLRSRLSRGRSRLRELTDRAPSPHRGSTRTLPSRAYGIHGSPARSRPLDRGGSGWG